MDTRPFVRLPAVRAVGRPDLPADLVEFYTHNEGVGFESDPDRPIRVCKLDELRKTDGWRDLGRWIGDPVPLGWDGLTAYRIGIGLTFEDILYVVHAPICGPGSILAIGHNFCCLGGDGTGELDSTFVLGSCFAGWLAHMEEFDWSEPVIASVGELTASRLEYLRRYYLRLNPAVGLR